MRTVFIFLLGGVVGYTFDRYIKPWALRHLARMKDKYDGA